MTRHQYRGRYLFICGFQDKPPCTLSNKKKGKKRNVQIQRRTHTPTTTFEHSEEEIRHRKQQHPETQTEHNWVGRSHLTSQLLQEQTMVLFFLNIPTNPKLRISQLATIFTGVATLSGVAFCTKNWMITYRNFFFPLPSFSRIRHLGPPTFPRI